MTVMECLSKKKIVIIGAAIVDVLVSPAEADVFSTGSYPAEEVRMTFGGDALNEATVLAALGKPVRLQTIIGSDAAGEMIRNHCEKLGIELEEGCVREELTTGVNVVLVQKSGERNFLTNRNGSLRKLTLGDVKRPFPNEADILCFASIFVFPEIGAGELAAIFRSAKKQGMTVCADMTKRKNGETAEELAEAFSYVDYLIPNEEEAFLITGETNVKCAAEKLRSCGAKCVIIKCGKKGCYLCNDETAKYVPAVEHVNCLDTTGAGDSFTAGFLYGLSEGWPVEKCARFAGECGARAVEKLGATSWCV